MHDSGLADLGTYYTVVVVGGDFLRNHYADLQSLCRCSSVTRTELTDHSQFFVTQRMT